MLPPRGVGCGPPSVPFGALACPSCVRPFVLLPGAPSYVPPFALLPGAPSSRTTFRAAARRTLVRTTFRAAARRTLVRTDLSRCRSAHPRTYDLSCYRSSRAGAASPRGTPGLPRQSAPGHGHPRLTSQRAANCARAPRRRTAATACAGCCIRACDHSRPRAARQREPYARSTCRREADSDGLPGRPCAMFSLANVVNLFADELAGLRGRGLAGPLVSARALDCSLFWHGFSHLYVFLISVQSWFVSVRNGKLHRPKDRTVVRVSGRALRKFRAGTCDTAAVDALAGSSPERLAHLGDVPFARRANSRSRLVKPFEPQCVLTDHLCVLRHERSCGGPSPTAPLHWTSDAGGRSQGDR